MMVYRFVRGSWLVSGLCFIGTTLACNAEPGPDNIRHAAEELGLPRMTACATKR